MKTVVVYKSKYGSAKTYAEWIAQELGADIFDAKSVRAEDLLPYDTIIYGGGLYAEIIAGVTLITKNFDRLKDKNLIVYTTAITPIDCRQYYDTLVKEKNFTDEMIKKIKIFNLPGKMLVSELTGVHRAAIKTLKKVMSSKKNPTDMEKLLIDLCDFDDDLCDRKNIGGIIDYVKKNF